MVFKYISARQNAVLKSFYPSHDRGNVVKLGATPHFFPLVERSRSQSFASTSLNEHLNAN